MYNICLSLIHFTGLAVFAVEKEVCTIQLTDISRQKVNGLKSFGIQFFAT